MEAAQAAQAAATGTQATPVGQLDRVGVAHHHVLDVAATIDQDADLSPDLPADRGQLPRELLRQQLIGGDTTPEEALDLANLVGLEAVRIAEDLDERLLLRLFQSTLSRAKRRYTSRASSNWANTCVRSFSARQPGQASAISWSRSIHSRA